MLAVFNRMLKISTNMTFFVSCKGNYNESTISHSTHVNAVNTVTVNNLTTTIKSFLSISGFLAKKFNITKFNGRHLNQDIIENYFGLMKGLCGTNDSPNPYQYSGNGLALLFATP